MIQKNSRPNHPTTCGKVERFQQTMKKWLRAQPDQPDHHRRAADPPRPLPRPSTTTTGRTDPCRTEPPPQRSTTPCPRPCPAPTRDADTHDRVRHDRVDKSGTVTLRVHGQLRHIGIGRTHKGTHVILLIQDLEVRIVNAVTGELLRELTIDTSKDYQPRTPK